ncbi:MAG: FtsQ-type POTRA domain-containing protein [Spirochaetaceae bacterium]
MNNSVLINLIYTLTVSLFIMLITAFFILPYFTIKEIKLNSSLSFSSSLEQIAGLDSYSSYLLIKPKIIEDRILKEPLVRKVSVEKSFPDTLNITVLGRKALAISYIKKDGISIPLCFDENGVVFKIGEEINDINLPVISGDIDFKKVTMGGELPRVLVPLLKSLKNVRGSVPKLYSSISEISVIKRGEMTFDLILNFTHSPIKALVKDVLTIPQLKNIVVVISLLDKEEISVDLVDFREDEIVYREKE